MNFLLGLTVVLALITIGYIVKIVELTSVLKDKKQTIIDKKGNNINAYLMLVFMIASFIGLYFVTKNYINDGVYSVPAATEHGPTLDYLFNITLIATGFVFILCNVILFVFAFKYKYKEGYKAYHFVDSHKLELIWTIIPSIVMAYLILQGGVAWNRILTTPPDDAYTVEITAKQFAWKIRYPGKDGKLGKVSHKLRTVDNELGLDLSDTLAQDDIIVGGASGFYLPVNKNVSFKINALDVLHSVFVPHFRVKMDAVPGMQTQFWFKPTITTAEMRKNLNNEDFNYELACAEVCGKSHFAMKSVIFVDSQQELDNWLSKQKSFAQTIKEKQVAAM